MKALRLEIYVSHFVVTLYDRRLASIMNYIVRDLRSFTFKKVPWKRKVEMVPDKTYAVVHEKEGVYRLPIGSLTSTLNTLGVQGRLSIEDLEIKRYKKRGTYDTVDLQFDYSKFTLRDYQKEYSDKLIEEDNDIKLVDLQTGKGKALRDTEYVKTINGWARIRSIKVGDKVLNPNGRYSKVKGVYRQGIRKIFRLFLVDGRTIDCDVEHLWNVRVQHNEDYRLDSPMVLNTGGLMDLVNKRRKELNVKVLLPLYSPNLTPRNTGLLLDPYIMGVYLVSGSSYYNTVIFALDKEDLADKIEHMLKENHGVSIHRYQLDNKHIVKIKCNIETECNRDFISIFQHYKLYGVGKGTSDFEIPTEYVDDSTDYEKYQVLSGMMDAGMERTEDKEVISIFKTPNFIFHKQVQTLAWSVGCCAKSITLETGDEKILYKLEIMHNTSLPNPEKNLHGLEIKAITYTEEAKATCIEVNSNNKLYVATDYIVTHNTLIACNALSRLKRRVAILILPRYIDKWLDDLKIYLNIDRKDVCVIQGNESLLDMMEHMEEYKKNYSVFIFSMRTVYGYLKSYADTDMVHYRSLPYKIPPWKLMSKLGIGVLLNDESHQEFHTLHRALLYFNVSKVIGLTATLSSNQKRVRELYNTIFPKEFRISNILKKDNYIHVNNIKYYADKPRRIPCVRTQGYSHIMFEQYTLATGFFLEQYDKMLYKYVKRDYINRKREGDKLLIFFSTVNMCKHYKEYLLKLHPDLDIRTFTQEDEYINILESDIIVSTLQSSSTAIDIPNLITTLQTVSIGSLGLNLQAMGRLRKIDGVEVIYNTIYCGNLRRQSKLNDTRLGVIKERAKSIDYEVYRPSNGSELIVG